MDSPLGEQIMPFLEFGTSVSFRHEKTCQLVFIELSILPGIACIHSTFTVYLLCAGLDVKHWKSHDGIVYSPWASVTVIIKYYSK